MAIQQIVPIYVTLKGDGASSAFVFALSNLYQQGFGGSVPFGSAGVVPSSIAVNNPPVPVTSATVDANGNITVTLTSPLGSGVVQTFELDLVYNSGAAVSSFAVQSQNVSLTNSPSVMLLDGNGFPVLSSNSSLYTIPPPDSVISGTVSATGPFVMTSAGAGRP